MIGRILWALLIRDPTEFHFAWVWNTNETLIGISILHAEPPDEALILSVGIGLCGLTWIWDL